MSKRKVPCLISEGKAIEQTRRNHFKMQAQKHGYRTNETKTFQSIGEKTSLLNKRDEIISKCRRKNKAIE